MNPVLDGIAPSLIRALNARKQPGDIDLGLGEPTLRPDPRYFDAAAAWVREHGCPYTVNAGFADLRAAIAAYHAIPDRGAENVCVTVGSEEAIYLALKAVLDPARDEVLIVEPCYLAYPKLCALEGIRHRTVAMDGDDGFRPDAARVLDALRPDTRMLILNSPANPTGRVWPEAELRALADGLAARPGPPVYVLSDEVYRELYFSAEAPVSIGALWPHSLVACSLSKSNAMTGLRLGWLVGGRAEIAAAVKVHQLVNTAASTFSQVVARAVFADPANLGEHRAHYAARLRLLGTALAENGLRTTPIEGAFYCMVRLPDAWAADSLGAAEALLTRAHVVATPGLAFGGSGEGWLRLSWVAEPDALAEGVRRIARFLAEPRG
ncbi:aminotransferase class I/II-fold pyridoxal phosphate-dependent enzyme [Longimicrobium terrae]|uniref:Aminotransferase n=1 Tax=Longimicrobium terrae TaxID=1639882 RepID=A0A841H7G1_9BACT|nr:aspartate/methionine/tyrosine aminotransferase [Longimicrobium terrae]MBB6074070.1 aminotransferase [Longimicrobium terrae]NNC28706.1 pyridoxal phosphate-dependent aminotransferase [Longimicrobium terrae]